ncbi:MAG: polyphosphate polymerase domain-containing protein [Bacteroidales bacterium]|nr:polyphosphate polymerase domain-containing protein [Bacteroidales bacterium]
MKDKNIKTAIDTVIEQFAPIGLEEMDSVKLLNRTDKKFVLPICKLTDILADMHDKYRLLYINDISKQSYYTIYFDTPDQKMYVEHQNGKLNRFKVRYRNYESTNAGFLEIKFKNNKGRTEKRRISFDYPVKNLSEANEFLQKNSPYKAEDLLPISEVRYIRLTFVNIANGERVTVDYNLQVNMFNHNEQSEDFDHICIIEVKRDKNSGISGIADILLKHRVTSNGMSKYCIGLAAVSDDIKKNRFKQKLRNLEKLRSDN